MKAIVDAKTFSTALDNAIAVMKRSMVPILESVQLQFGGGKCVMTATDMDTWLTLEIPAEGDDFTCAFYRTKEAAKICRHYDGSLMIEAVDVGEERTAKRQLLLSCGSRKASFEGFLPAECEDFPKAACMETEGGFVVNAASLLEQVNRIKYAVGKERDTTNATKTCVQFDKDKVFCMDGYRVACVNDPGFVVPKPFLIYPEVLTHLKVFGKETITVDVDYRFVRFSGNGASVQCHRQGVVPFSLDQAIPKGYREEFYVSPKEFLRELDYLKELIPNKGRRPYLRFCNGELSLESGAQNGCTAIHIEGKNSIGFGFDVRYMTDALKQFEKEARVKLKVVNSCMPITLEAEGRNDYSLVLPVQMKEIRTAA